MIRQNVLIGGIGLFISFWASAEATTAMADCSEGDREIRPVSQQEPYYPHSAMMFCLTGRVKAEFTVDEQGRTRDIRVVESEPEAVFDRAAVGTIEQWRFTPACRNGERAERQAVQTIEFELPGDSGGDCNASFSELDEEMVRLLGEIGARYALLAQYWGSGKDWPETKTAISAPFGEFEGDLGRVAAFHRRALENIPPAGRGNDLNQLYTTLSSALKPHLHRPDAPYLEMARGWLDYYRLALDERVEQSRESYEQLASDFQRLKRDTQLDEDLLELLVIPFVGDPELPFDEAIEPRLRLLDHFESIFDFLESRRDEWRVANHDIHFERREDERTWQALWSDLKEHEDMLRSRDVKMLRSFQDYSD